MNARPVRASMEIALQALLRDTQTMLSAGVDDVYQRLGFLLIDGKQMARIDAYLASLHRLFTSRPRRLAAQLSGSFENIQFVPGVMSDFAMIPIGRRDILSVLREYLGHVFVEPFQLVPDREAKVLDFLRYQIVCLLPLIQYPMRRPDGRNLAARGSHCAVACGAILSGINTYRGGEAVVRKDNEAQKY